MKSLLLSLAVSAFGCESAPEAITAFVPATQASWRRAREEVAELRRTVPREPYVQIVRADFRAPSGQHLVARGALAVAPGRALRLILLGPAGRTVLDVWATLDRYELSVPDLGVVERGGAVAPPHLPIELFREAIIRPAAGRLLAAGTVGSDRVYLVRANSRALELRVRPEVSSPTARRFTIRKFDAQGGETVEWLAHRSSLVVGAGESVRFRRPAMGIDLTLEVEQLSDSPPDPDAFAPPESLRAREEAPR